MVFFIVFFKFRSLFCVGYEDALVAESSSEHHEYAENSAPTRSTCQHAALQLQLALLNSSANTLLRRRVHTYFLIFGKTMTELIEKTVPTSILVQDNRYMAALSESELLTEVS